MKSYKLALLVEREHVFVSLWSRGLREWKISASERIALRSADPLPEQILGAIRPLVLRWALPPDTPVYCVVQPPPGGLVSLKFPRKARKDLAALVDFELAKSLPFPLKEVERGFQTVAEGNDLLVSVFWLPKAWLTEIRNALARAGLRLTEVFHRAQLVGTALSTAAGASVEGKPWGYVEQDGDTVYLHLFRHGALPATSRALGQVADPTVVQNLHLELLACQAATPGSTPLYLAPLADDSLLGRLRDAAAAHGEITLKPYESKLDFAALLLAFWKQGGEGVWLVPDRASMMARLTPVGLVLVIVGVLASATVWWLVSGARDDVAALEADASKVKPHYQKAVAVEKQLLDVSEQIHAVEAMASGPRALDVLYEVFKFLPDKAWLLRFGFTLEGASFEGYGISGQDLQKKLKQSGKFSQVALREPKLAKDQTLVPFALEVKWRPSGMGAAPAGPSREQGMASPGAASSGTALSGTTGVRQSHS
jgi:hypothetical protein